MQTKSKLLFVLFSLSLLVVASPALADEDPSDDADDEASQQAQADDDIKVLEAKSAGAVEDREVVDEKDSFSTGDSVFVWLAVQNPKQDSTLDVVWSVDDREIHTFAVDVGESWRWRTWAQLKVAQAGDWKAEVRDDSGTVLETVEFAVAD